MVAKDGACVGLLVPITRTVFLQELFASIAAQTSPPDEVLLLLNASDEVALSEMRSEIQGLVCRQDPVLEKRIRTLETSSRLLTSVAADVLLRNCNVDFACLVADDDMLATDFVECWRGQLREDCSDCLMSPWIERFMDVDGARITLGVVDPTVFLTSRPPVNRILSLFGGLVAGGGTTFPVSLARELNVFASPVPIVTEDQLLSARFFRSKVNWRPLIGARYIGRVHPDQTGGGSDLEAYGNGVVRAVQIKEERVGLHKVVASAALWRDLHRISPGARARFVQGYADAGGSKRLAKFAERTPMPRRSLDVITKAKKRLLQRTS